MVILCTLLCITACTRAEPGDSSVRQWKLPNTLREISGLAFDRDGDLVAHDDERGIVYKLDPKEGRILDERLLRTPLVSDDFEGIASTPEGIYLVSSEGMLFNATGVFDLGTRESCEIEGLTYDGAYLVAVCKTIYGASERRIRLYFIDTEDHAVASTRDILLDHDVRPSGIAWDATKSRFLILASSPRAIYVMGPSGDVERTVRLDPQMHSQPEGIEIKDENIFIADEGRNGKARLTLYADLL